MCVALSAVEGSQADWQRSFGSLRSPRMTVVKTNLFFIGKQL
jgi:hypothetical protein